MNERLRKKGEKEEVWERRAGTGGKGKIYAHKFHQPGAMKMLKC